MHMGKITSHFLTYTFSIVGSTNKGGGGDDPVL